MVRCSEKACHREQILQGGIVVELGTVIERYCQELPFMLFKDLDRSPGNLGGCPGFELLDYHIAGLPFHERQDAVPAVGTYDGIPFPMPQDGP